MLCYVMLSKASMGRSRAQTLRRAHQPRPPHHQRIGPRPRRHSSPLRAPGSLLARAREVFGACGWVVAALRVRERDERAIWGLHARAAAHLHRRGDLDVRGTYLDVQIVSRCPRSVPQSMRSRSSPPTTVSVGGGAAGVAAEGGGAAALSTAAGIGFRSTSGPPTSCGGEARSGEADG